MIRLTEDQYIITRRQNITDKVLIYTWIPFMIVFVLIGIALYNGATDGAAALGIFGSTSSLVLWIFCSRILSTRIAKYKVEYTTKYLTDLESKKQN